MNIIERIKYWWYARKLSKTHKIVPLTNDIYAIKIKDGQNHFVRIPKEQETFPYEYAKYLRNLSEIGYRFSDCNQIKIDEEKIKNKDKDWMDEEE